MATIAANDVRVLVVDGTSDARTSIVPTLQTCGYHGATLSSPATSLGPAILHRPDPLHTMSFLTPPSPGAPLAPHPATQLEKRLGCRQPCVYTATRTPTVRTDR